MITAADIRQALLHNHPDAFMGTNVLVAGTTGDDIDEDALDTLTITVGITSTIKSYGGRRSIRVLQATLSGLSGNLTRATAMADAFIALSIDAAANPVARNAMGNTIQFIESSIVNYSIENTDDLTAWVVNVAFEFWDMPA